MTLSRMLDMSGQLQARSTHGLQLMLNSQANLKLITAVTAADALDTACTQASIWDRQHGSACPFCTRRRPCACNSLAALHPQLVALQWDNERNGTLSPRDLLPGSKMKVSCCTL